eukprot:CAMPEP_0179138166 /NCGR_PEP_ID=MMETSP0796-20121207/65966_1 /TAXON_ID=73915 /ORGANISM="Pyrodinium bahamense, Strain pbaha01" /LENGTH=285 /DNA_ID=CAMNT_0020837421 /DNA_START=32 /DNA_END=889 /DNA_ORIENTATION=-
MTSSAWGHGTLLTGAAAGWLSHSLGMFVDAAQSRFRTTDERAHGLDNPLLHTFDWLPERERHAMLRLRDRAETRACDVPGDALDLGLERLCAWASTLQCAGAETGEDVQPWAAVSPRWKHLGFQSADPRTDFRTGILAVDNLVHLCEAHSPEAEQMCAEASSESMRYPFAVASINLTQLLAWYLLLIPGPSILGQDTGIEPLDDPMQLHAFARLCVHGDAFGELHSNAMIRLHLAWHEGKVEDPGASVAIFAKGLQDTLAAVDAFIRTSPLESTREFMRIYSKSG